MSVCHVIILNYVDTRYLPIRKVGEEGLSLAPSLMYLMSFVGCGFSWTPCLYVGRRIEVEEGGKWAEKRGEVLG